MLKCYIAFFFMLLSFPGFVQAQKKDKCQKRFVKYKSKRADAPKIVRTKPMWAYSKGFSNPVYLEMAFALNENKEPVLLFTSSYDVGSFFGQVTINKVNEVIIQFEDGTEEKITFENDAAVSGGGAGAVAADWLLGFGDEEKQVNSVPLSEELLKKFMEVRPKRTIITNQQRDNGNIMDREDKFLDSNLTQEYATCFYERIKSGL